MHIKDDLLRSVAEVRLSLMRWLIDSAAVMHPTYAAFFFRCRLNFAHRAF